MKITLPTKKGTPNTNPEISFEQLVIVGANGAGKTRFGSQIEETYPGQTHRISAQKSLRFPTEVSPKSKDRAEKEFFYGNYYEPQYDRLHLQQKFANRWGRQLNTYLLDDFEKLLVLLHTEEYEESLSYKEGLIAKPVTRLDKVQQIWELVLPHRKLIKRAGVIETFPTGDEASRYNASEMSDGERVIFYLIAEVVCAPKEVIIIIDEPEMHIHKSLIKSLFDLIEIERPDCSFVYLTHDIDFAFTRQNAVKIWAKAFEKGIWDYEILDQNMQLPEQLYLEVLGSRKPIIFLEGDNSSIDYEIYEQVYSNFTLKPLGSCDKVIQSVKSFNELNSFHHLESYGIVDRDRRQSDDLKYLNSKKIWVLDVAEVENILLLENNVRSIASYMGKDPNDVFTKVKDNLITFFKAQLEGQILLHFKELLRREYFELTNFKSKTFADATTEINSTFGTIDRQKVYTTVKKDFDDAVNSSDYKSVLRLFNLKNALIPESKVCELTGVRNKEEYKKLLVTLLKKKDTTSHFMAEGIDEVIIKNAT